MEVSNVVWCTGFDMDLSWIGLPVIGDDGFPVQDRGVAPSQPRLYFVGMPFLSSLSSALLGGVGRDAAHIADHIARRTADLTAASVSVATFRTAQ